MTSTARNVLSPPPDYNLCLPLSIKWTIIMMRGNAHEKVYEHETYVHDVMYRILAGFGEARDILAGHAFASGR